MVLIVVLVILGLGSRKSAKTENSNQPVKIGVAVGLTGYAANWGEGEVKAIQLALDEYKDKIDKPIELIFEDTKSDGLGTVNAIKKLIEVDRVSSIIGPTWGDSFQGGYPIAQAAGVSVISPSAAFETVENKNQFPYIFSTWWPQHQEAKALIKDMLNKGITKIVIVHDEDAFNTKFGDIFAEELSKEGKKIISRVVVPIGTTDFRTHITKLKTSNPEAILVLPQDTASVGTFMKQLREQKVVSRVYSTTSAQNEENLEKFPGLFEELLYSFPNYSHDKKYIELKQRLIKRYGENTAEGPAFVNAYNAASMLFTVLSEGSYSREDIRNGLPQVKISGIGTDNLFFDQNGQIGNINFMIKTVSNNKFIEI